MKFRKNIKKIMPVVLCMVLLLRFLIPLTAWAADSSDNEEYRKLSNLHLYEVAESGESGYTYSKVEKMAAPGWNDEDCPTTLKTWYSSMLTNNAKFKEKFGGITSEDFVRNYRLYLIVTRSVDSNYNSYFAFIMKKDVRICMRYSEDVGMVAYYPYDVRGGVNGMTSDAYTIDSFKWSVLEIGGQSTKKLSYSANPFSTRYSNTVTVKGVEYGCFQFCSNATVQAYGSKGGLVYTNIPLVDDASDVVKYIDMQDDSVTTNKGGGKKEVGEGCDSFGWDSFDCSLTKNGTDGYMFLANYSYDSYTKMVASPEDYQIVIRFTMSTTYRYKSSVIQEDSWSTEYMTYDLSPNCLKSLRINGSNIKFQPNNNGSQQTTGSGKIVAFTYQSVLEYIAALRGVDIGELSSVDSCYIYANIMLYKKGGNAGYSSDVQQFRWDFSTLTKQKLTPNVKTTGEGSDKKVTGVVGNDEGKTVINITVNVTGGNGGDGGSGGNGGSGGSGGSGGNGGDGGDGGSGGSGGSGIGVDDDNSKSFWSILKGIVAFFKALLDGEDGLFPVIAAFFEFIPASFWTVVIGAVVIIAVIAIYRLLKKS